MANKNGNGTKSAQAAMATNVLAPERMAPHSVEAEESVLGSILLNPDSLYEVSTFLKVDDFFIVRNGWIYDAILKLADAEQPEGGDVIPIDNITVANKLREQGRLEEVGGVAYITYLINHTPSSIYTEVYGRIIERAAIRRRMLDAASEIAKLAHKESESIEEQIDEASAALDSAIDRKAGHTSAKVADVIDEVIDEILAENDGDDDEDDGVVDTGFKDLDQLIDGFGPEEFIILAGRPGSGKSSLILTMAYNQAKGNKEGKNKMPVAISSLEMGKKQITRRLVSIDTGISVSRLKKKGKRSDLTPEEKSKVEASRARIKKLPIIIDDEASPSVTSLKMKARVWKRKHGIKILYTDYLQLFDGVGDTREAAVSYVSRKHKQLARELGIPVVAAAQLNRDVESLKDKRPQLHHLRESGSLEQDADKIIFIYRDEMYNENTERPNQADLLIAKHRDGPTGVVSLFFRKELTHFAPLKKTNVDFAEFAADTDAANSTVTKPPEPPKPRSRPWYEDEANEELEKLGF